ncbi:hypothetical protein [Chitinophaga sp. MM2321]|uniref:hypothetical protein n=1 Tax=Chitinophaga sp. MM2321 TaxID=3137178 RepID=UPI0032D576A6
MNLTFLQEIHRCSGLVKDLDVLLKEIQLRLIRVEEALEAGDPRFKSPLDEFKQNMLLASINIHGIRKRIHELINFLDDLPQPLPEAPHQFEQLENEVDLEKKEFAMLSISFYKFITTDLIEMYK